MIAFGPFRFDGASGDLRKDTKPVPLTSKAASVLGRLLERPITKIESIDRELGRHLRATIRTGAFLAYVPSRDRAEENPAARESS